MAKGRKIAPIAVWADQSLPEILPARLVSYRVSNPSAVTRVSGKLADGQLMNGIYCFERF